MADRHTASRPDDIGEPPSRPGYRGPTTQRRPPPPPSPPDPPRRRSTDADVPERRARESGR